MRTSYINILSIETKSAIHRHTNTSEVVEYIYGSAIERFYDKQGNEDGNSFLSNHSAKKMYEIVNKQVKFLTSQYIGTCKSAYTKGYAIN